MIKNSANYDKCSNDISSRNSTRTWQDILDELTRKSGKNGLIEIVKNENTLGEKLSRVMDSVIVRYEYKTLKIYVKDW